MALTVTKLFMTYAGNKIFAGYKVIGDTATTTWTAPLHELEAVWYQRGTDMATDEKLTFATNVVTWAAAVTPATGYGYLYFVGV